MSGRTKSAFTYGDFTEDVSSGGHRGGPRRREEVEDFTAYARTFDVREVDQDAVAAGPPAGSKVRRALALIAEAETGALTKESADELRSLLEDIEKKT